MGWTSLHLACYHDQMNIVFYLLNNGADKNIQNHVLILKKRLFYFIGFYLIILFIS